MAVYFDVSFPKGEVLDIKDTDINEGGTCRESPIFTGDMSKLRKLSIEQCETPESLDWLVDDVLASSCPTQLQIIRYGHGVPFSPVSFARLVALSAKSLQKLDIDPPGRETVRGWDNPPPFTNQSFPSLMSLTFAVVQMHSDSESVFTMNWCRRVVEVFPPAPKMTSLTIHFFASGPLQADRIAADQSFDWKQLSERTSELFPELKRFIIRVSYHKHFREGQRALSGALLKKRLEHFGNKLVIEWAGCRTVWTGF
ncbi:hypothetical protein EDD18DRAFT_61482 [Armillaria luteobubalina]|uniref:Uncharacterized protein n=1 Tax=Armillaria luteobubalina TaxID=153913 RepID=A0AA39UVD6_9AGAR|nr:hypothetical protein EDD18DRAFT_61482 [Armillaria luteobubalina]